MHNEEVYKLIQGQTDNLKEVVEAKLSGFKAEISSGMDIHTYKLDQLIEYQEKQNNRIGKLENKVHKNTAWRVKITVAGTVIAGGISFILIKLGPLLKFIKNE